MPPACSLSVWTDEGPPAESDTSSLLSLAPVTVVHARLRLEHQHILYGDYDPLLGIQTIELALAEPAFAIRFRLIESTTSRSPGIPGPSLPTTVVILRHFVSAPDSLHLEAHMPGHQYYRYPERPVRYGSRLRLRFWYLIAAGTEGECRVRLGTVQGYAHLLA